MDNLTLKQRRRTMRAVRAKNTAPELVIRRLVSALGYRYRLHRADLPGTPDLVFASRKKVVFVHGCYWHRHCCNRGRVVPAVNRDYWEAKFSRNMKRDRDVRRRLRSMGWRFLEIWECELVEEAATLQLRISRFLD